MGTGRRSAGPADGLAGVDAHTMPCRTSGLRMRQQRLGILANPNRPPKPPIRRVRLTGKWFNMRSGRRARVAEGADGADSAILPGAGDTDLMASSGAETARAGTEAATAPVAGDGAAHDSVPGDMGTGPSGSPVSTGAGANGRLAYDGEGGRLRIDINRLMGAVEQEGRKTMSRQPYGIVTQRADEGPGQIVATGFATAMDAPDGNAAPGGVAGGVANTSGDADAMAMPCARHAAGVVAEGGALRGPLPQAPASTPAAAPSRTAPLHGTMATPDDARHSRPRFARPARLLILFFVAVLVMAGAWGALNLPAGLVPAG